jgi:outer membrane protein assembly factor BamA
MVLIPASPAGAQDTRAQQIATLQSDKATQLGPEGPDGAERALVWIMSSPLLAGTGGAFPWFGSVYEGTGFGVGGGYLRRMPRYSRLMTIAGVSANGSTVLRADYTAPRLFGDRIEPYAGVRWTRAKGMSFYGVGNDSSLDDRAGYDFDPARFSAGLTYHPRPWLEFSAGYEHVGFETRVNGSTVSRPLLDQLSDRTRLRFNGTRLGAAFDTRTSPGYSTRGTLLRAATSYFSETRDQPFEFRQSELEAVQLVPLVREQFVLAFRGMATFTNPDAGNGVPLALLPYLGSGSTLRGFSNRRFVDRDTVILTGEYRWRPSRFIDMAVFLDAGQVAPTAGAMAWDRMKTSWGIGARFHGPAFSAFRVDVAHGVEGFHVVFAAGPAF